MLLACLLPRIGSNEAGCEVTPVRDPRIQRGPVDLEALSQACLRRARETLEVVFAHRLHLGGR